jgi:hypothetical protein
MPRSKSPFFEVQGLVPCPVEDEHECPTPEYWCTLYHLLSEEDGKETLLAVMESSSPLYDKYEDFRLVPPIAKRLERFLEHEGYAWERGNSSKRKRRRPSESSADDSVAEVIPIQRGKRTKVKKR